MKHATERRIRNHLGKSCTAETLGGLVRYVRNHPGCLRGIWAGAEQYAQRRALLELWERRRRLNTNERERRRCQHDPAFRRQRVRELRRVCRVSAAAYSPERWEEATTAERAARALGLGARVEVHDVWPVIVYRDDLSYKPVGLDSEITATLGLPQRNRVPGETTWKNGKPISYSRATDNNWILSAVRRRAGGRAADYLFQEPNGERGTWRHDLPEGWRWDCDQNGPRIVHGPDDYHPGSRELRGGTDKLIARLNDLAQRRRETAARAAAELADNAGVWVCLADSVRAGNCREGSVKFARRHGIDSARHYGALELLTMANGDAGRVRLAIRAAVERSRRETNVGHCVLAEHVA